MGKEVTFIERLIEKEIPQKFKDPITVLDALLQFSQNPTSASAGYGVEENYPYIENNLRKRYELSREELIKITNFLKRVFKKMEKINFDIYYWRDLIKDTISERKKNLFVDWYISKFQKLKEEDQKKFIFLLLSLEKERCLDKFHCFFDKEETVNQETLNDIVVGWGLGNVLFYRSSGGYERFELVLSPFLPHLREKLRENFYVDKKDIEAFFSNLNVDDIRLIEKCIIQGGILESKEGKCLQEKRFLIESSRSFWAIWPPAINEFKELITSKKRDETKELVKAINSILSSFAKDNFPLVSVRPTLELDGAYAWHLDFVSQPTKPPVSVDILVAPWLFPVSVYRDILDEFWSRISLPHIVFLFFAHENFPTLSTKFSKLSGLTKWYSFIQMPGNEFYPIEFGSIREEMKDAINDFLAAFLPYLFRDLRISTQWKSITAEKMQLYLLLKENPKVLELIIEGLDTQPIVTDFLRDGLRRKFGGSTEKWKEEIIQRRIFGENIVKKWEDRAKNRLYAKDFLDGATFGEIIGIIGGLPELLEGMPTNKELFLSSLNVLNKWRNELWGHPVERVAKVQLTKEQHEGIKRALKNVKDICEMIKYT
jgi:hypothetical protein